MAVQIHAIYENGQLRLLEPVDLPDGQHVKIEIAPLSEDERVREALADLSVRWHDSADDRDAWVEEMAEEIRNAYTGEKPLSEIIIEERGES
jgi:predicted DNA-binding antitoxin AbrB/MazE fold protein